MAQRTYRLMDTGTKMGVIDEFNHGRTVAWYDRNQLIGFIELGMGAQEYKREVNWLKAVRNKFPNLKEG